MNITRWQKLMHAMGLPDSIDYFESLLAAYQEPHRFYHTHQHIKAMLKHFDASKDLAKRPTELELAIWFHDAIYKPLSSRNELDSANWAKEFLTDNGYNSKGVQRVHDLIMATKHQDDIIGHDEQLLVDIDLAILGSPAEIYEQFEANVRKEYRCVPGFIYRKKRKEILRSFIDRKSIYYTEFYRNQFESQARTNIQRAIESL